MTLEKRRKLEENPDDRVIKCLMASSQQEAVIQLEHRWSGAVTDLFELKRDGCQSRKPRLMDTGWFHKKQSSSRKVHGHFIQRKY